ncbi:Tetraspanin-12 [Manis javanica]|nr:Tetraspanin-12 [Manis javanica]
MRGILDTCSNSAFPRCLCPLDPDSPETKMAEQFQDSCQDRKEQFLEENRRASCLRFPKELPSGLLKSYRLDLCPRHILNRDGMTIIGLD